MAGSAPAACGFWHWVIKPKYRFFSRSTPFARCIGTLLHVYVQDYLPYQRWDVIPAEIIPMPSNRRSLRARCARFVALRRFAQRQSLPHLTALPSGHCTPPAISLAVMLWLATGLTQGTSSPASGSHTSPNTSATLPHTHGCLSLASGGTGYVYSYLPTDHRLSRSACLRRRSMQPARKNSVDLVGGQRIGRVSTHGPIDALLLRHAGCDVTPSPFVHGGAHDVQALLAAPGCAWLPCAA